ncbi:hypothetical protein [Acidithiobacillus sp. AMEEHan]|uniref:hypothetical protein n=1 Tax=Acidithiobacillus sp. AMEEHan TaxID=2994951 RepID=UPI0027E55330|nr:hypothetical protein [Acidithiobacillus sp. AMEEHan]
MSISDLLPVVSRLSHAEKFRLVQVMLQQLAEDEGISVKTTADQPAPFDPRSFYGRGQATRERIDAYLNASRQGWER